MTQRRVGLWLIGAHGGVATTAALGLAALAEGLTDTTGLTTALPLFDGLDLDPPSSFVVGGHEVRRSSYREAAAELHRDSRVFDEHTLAACLPALDEWDANVRPGTVRRAGTTIEGLADLPGARAEESPRAAIDRLQADLTAFQGAHRLDQVVVLHVASTEPPRDLRDVHNSFDRVRAALDRPDCDLLPASSLYAYAALDLGWPYVNFTPSLGASCPALEELSRQRRAPHAGQDGKTGETLLKTVLAPMFALRNLQVMSWVGHNIFGNRDGLVLDDPANKAAKVRTKDQVLTHVLGYKPQTLVTIEYIPSMGDWKTAWDHIHFKGFLGTPMTMQFTWQGCDSLLAAPLVIDLARLALLAARRGESGVLPHLACFFKNPLGTTEHDVFRQFAMLEEYVQAARGPSVR